MHYEVIYREQDLSTFVLTPFVDLTKGVIKKNIILQIFKNKAKRLYYGSFVIYNNI